MFIIIIDQMFLFNHSVLNFAMVSSYSLVINSTISYIVRSFLCQFFSNKNSTLRLFNFQQNCI